jgi:hypothetical protein
VALASVGFLLALALDKPHAKVIRQCRTNGIPGWRAAGVLSSLRSSPYHWVPSARILATVRPFSGTPRFNC